MTNNKDKDQPSATLSESQEPFSDGIKEALADPNEARKERLKEAIKAHALANRKVVKARRAPQ